MERKQPVRQPGSGAKAIAIDARKIFARYRLYLLLSLLGCASLALALSIFFGR
ncbi:MAG: hypothetical protein J2P36_03135 [Ktedonobacteraceae bacterium]|jgi:hypothetical protein|nr:hypothetical protein [Ktedonobacteraceae bacterium]